MKEKKILKFLILIFWTLFWGLSVLDKVIPDVHYLWVGKDFFALFVKFFGSLGLKNPVFPTAALSVVSSIEAINFVFYLLALINYFRSKTDNTKKWFFRGILTSITLFGLFSIADQVFGDRFQLLEHGLFWLILIASWLIYKYIEDDDIRVLSLKNKEVKIAILIGILLTSISSISIIDFSNKTFSNVSSPVRGIEVVSDVYKFDFPFLADKMVWEKTINQFKSDHPELKINYIYTGPSELNSKKKTHMLLYVFTEKRKL